MRVSGVSEEKGECLERGDELDATSKVARPGTAGFAASGLSALFNVWDVYGVTYQSQPV